MPFPVVIKIIELCDLTKKKIWFRKRKLFYRPCAFWCGIWLLREFGCLNLRGLLELLLHHQEQLELMRSWHLYEEKNIYLIKAEFTCLLNGSVMTFNRWLIRKFRNYEKSPKMPKVWKKMKKSLVQKLTDESSVKSLITARIH